MHQLAISYFKNLRSSQDIAVSIEENTGDLGSLIPSIYLQIFVISYVLLFDRQFFLPGEDFSYSNVLNLELYHCFVLYQYCYVN